MKNVVFLLVMIIFLAVSGYSDILTSQSGNWSEATTWTGGVVPSENDNVIIGAGHKVTIDNANAKCKNISFSDTSAHLIMGTAEGVLSVYGDFSLAAVSHKVFSAWISGAKIKFTGSAEVQKLKGWNTAGSSTSFMEMIVDKAAGKVTTDSTNERFSFGTSLEIISGNFELQATDDIETRDINGTGTYGTFLIQKNGLFTMLGGTSHIRRGTFTDSVSKRTGKWTIYGKAILTTSSSNFINCGGIDIENGGQVNLNTGWSTGYFNPSLITVKDGGILYNLTTTNFWHASASVVIEQGGEFNSATSTTVLPLSFVNNGTIRFSRSNDQTLPAGLTNFNNLFLSGSGIKTLGANITVQGTLSLRGTATLNLGGFSLTYGPNAILQYGTSGQTSPQTTADAEFPETNGPKNLTIYNTGGVTLHSNRTVSGTLVLSNGIFDNNGSDDSKVLTLSDNATVRRNSGELTAAPIFSNKINIEYGSTLSQVTTGYEVPQATDKLNNLTISSTKGINLGSEITVNGNATFETGAGNILTGTNKLILKDNSNLTGEASTSSVIGNIEVTRTPGTAASDFGKIGFEIESGSDNLGSVKVIRTNGTDGIVNVSGVTSVARKFTVTSANEPISGRRLTFTWLSSEDSSKNFSSGNLAKLCFFNNASNKWQLIGSPVNISGIDPRKISASTSKLNTLFTVFDSSMVPSGIIGTIDLKNNSFGLEQNYPNPFNPTTKISYSVAAASKVKIELFNITGELIKTLVNEEINQGKYEYVLNINKGLGSGVYFYKMTAQDKMNGTIYSFTKKLTVIK